MTEPNKSIIKPILHRMEGDLKRCDPTTTDHTHPIEEWRIERMQKELEDGFNFIRPYRLAATIFGSARSRAADPVYQEATDLARRLSQSGFAIVTGGAAGIMEAANRGAYEAGGESIGLHINLPHEQQANPFLTKCMDFNYFFTRKVMLAFASEVYVYFPGGYGTLNEFFEILTLVQTSKIKPIPIVLYGKTFWEPILSNLSERLYTDHQFVDQSDLSLYTLVNSVEEAYSTILKLVKC